MESSKAELFAKRVHLECCTEIRLFVACFICTWPANSPFFVVCTDKHFNIKHPQIPSNTA